MDDLVPPVRGDNVREPERRYLSVVLRRHLNRVPGLTSLLGQHLLDSGFAKWQLPDRFEVIDAVPRTSTGKFWKLKLRERFAR